LYLPLILLDLVQSNSNSTKKINTKKKLSNGQKNNNKVHKTKLTKVERELERLNNGVGAGCDGSEDKSSLFPERCNLALTGREREGVGFGSVEEVIDIGGGTEPLSGTIS
jgi:hypothetical protein